MASLWKQDVAGWGAASWANPRGPKHGAATNVESSGQVRTPQLNSEVIFERT